MKLPRQLRDQFSRGPTPQYILTHSDLQEVPVPACKSDIERRTFWRRVENGVGQLRLIRENDQINRSNFQRKPVSLDILRNIVDHLIATESYAAWSQNALGAVVSWTQHRTLLQNVQLPTLDICKSSSDVLLLSLLQVRRSEECQAYDKAYSWLMIAASIIRDRELCIRFRLDLYFQHYYQCGFREDALLLWKNSVPRSLPDILAITALYLRRSRSDRPSRSELEALRNLHGGEVLYQFLLVHHEYVPYSVSTFTRPDSESASYFLTSRVHDSERAWQVLQRIRNFRISPWIKLKHAIELIPLLELRLVPLAWENFFDGSFAHVHSGVADNLRNFLNKINSDIGGSLTLSLIEQEALLPWNMLERTASTTLFPPERVTDPEYLEKYTGTLKEAVSSRSSYLRSSWVTGPGVAQLAAIYTQHKLSVCVSRDGMQQDFAFDEEGVPSADRFICRCGLGTDWRGVDWLDNGDIDQWLLSDSQAEMIDSARFICLSTAGMLTEFPWQACFLHGKQLAEGRTLVEIVSPERQTEFPISVDKVVYFGVFSPNCGGDNLLTVSTGVTFPKENFVPLESVSDVPYPFLEEVPLWTTSQMSEALRLPQVIVVSSHAVERRKLDGHFEEVAPLVLTHDGSSLDWRSVLKRTEVNAAVIFCCCFSLVHAKWSVTLGAPWALGFRGEIPNEGTADYVAWFLGKIRTLSCPIKAFHETQRYAMEHGWSQGVWGNAQLVVPTELAQSMML